MSFNIPKSTADLFQNPRIKEKLSLIESKMLEAIIQLPPKLQAKLRYSIYGGGKRLRPLLTVLTCEAVGGSLHKVLPIAAAYELAHNAALIQDDVIDNAEKRRGKSSLWKIFGKEEAWLLSDLLIFEIFRILSEYEKLGLEQPRLYRIINLIYESARNATYGEILELESKDKQEVSEEEILEIARLKTGSLLASAAAAGTIVGGGSAEEISFMYSMGESLGIAFQIQDDVLDVMSTEEELGKPIFTDFRCGKKNFLMAHALGAGNGDEQNFLLSLLNKPVISEKEVLEAREIFMRLGSVGRAITLSSEYLERARKYAYCLKPSEAKDEIIQLIYMLENRLA